MTPVPEGTTARHWRIGGRVQGVGYRPFVARLAAHHGLTGSVRNRMGEVEVLACGPSDVLDRFGEDLIAEAPPLADPHLISAEPSDERPGSFAILDSEADGPADIHIPPDSFACSDCLSELRAPMARRYRYPFINCTQCGPRYTIIASLPYDRPRTAMAGFPLCEACDAEYEDPADRRYHAEPLACPDCGPSLSMDGLSGEEALTRALELLRSGGILAMKGVGGYHLLCDARDPQAVALLRARKRRPAKPFAVMVPDESWLSRCARITPSEIEFLSTPTRPILLLPKESDAPLAESIAPGSGDYGLMLPPSPLHLLLAEGFGAPLIATSGNLSGEPICISEEEAEERLSGIADGFLHHNRPVLRPVDDPVFRPLAGSPLPIRHGRGTAPVELDLPFELPRPVLALGAQQKGSVALGFGRRAVVSQHLGDMESAAAQDLTRRIAADLQKLYGVTAEAVLCDAHPGYASTRMAEETGLPVSRIWHHHAHASALAGEHETGLPWLIFTWDGTGLGPDGTIHGGEALYGTPGHWQRVATLRPFRLPGGETVARNPWRSAASLLWETGAEHIAPEDPANMLHMAWQRGLNSPVTSSAGRLFDAASALAGLCRTASFEGEAAMALEAACGSDAPAVSLPMTEENGLLTTDWAPLIPMLTGATPLPERASIFHASLARALTDQAHALRQRFGPLRIGLSGGVFQNRRLTGLISQTLEIHLPKRLPVNDAGLSFGQIIDHGWSNSDG